jgi:acetyl-CoA C-acetyltransferase
LHAIEGKKKVMTKPVYIYDSIRSPRARAKESGGLHDLSPHDLLKALYSSLQQRNNLDPQLIGDVVLGCATQYGEQGGNIAKTSTLYAGWPSHINGMTVNRFCSSSIDAINIAAMKVATGQESAVLAGGIEMMSRVPMLSDQAAIFIDPQLAAACQVLMMGNGADLAATLNNISRKQVDELAVLSQQRAATARDEGYFKSIVPIYNPTKDITVSEDECIRADTTLESLAALEPAFAKLGSKGADAIQLAAYPQLKKIEHIHTAGNSPAMADAAAVMLIGDEALGKKLGISPRARIVAAANACDDPMQVLTGCVAATKKLLLQQNLTAADVDLFELHEAFAATVLKCQKDLNIPIDKLNVNGGVIAMGHPMGATGAIMTGVLLDELERRGLQSGIVAASGAAGVGSALLIER